jgi:hypothetical protein
MRAAKPGAAIAGLDMDWMQDAACRHMPDLPWIAERGEGPVVLRDLMAQLCGACRVREACARFVIEGDVTSGFWAGRDRNVNEWSVDGRRSVQGVLFEHDFGDVA